MEGEGVVIDKDKVEKFVYKPSDDEIARSVKEHELMQKEMFADPRECKTMDDIVGREDEKTFLEKARRFDWVPRKMDVSRMADLISMVKNDKSEGEELKVVDVAGSSGMLDRLVLDELDANSVSGVLVDVVDPSPIADQAAEYYKDKEPRLSFSRDVIEGYVAKGKKADVVICSWMLPGMNLRPSIEQLDPKMIIFVKDTNGKNHSGSTGVKEAYDDSEKYVQAASWMGFSSFDIESMRRYYDFADEVRYNNVFLVLTKKEDSLLNEKIFSSLERNKEKVLSEEKYPWEEEIPKSQAGTMIRREDVSYGTSDETVNYY